MQKVKIRKWKHWMGGKGKSKQMKVKFVLRLVTPQNNMLKGSTCFARGRVASYIGKLSWLPDSWWLSDHSTAGI